MKRPFYISQIHFHWCHQPNLDIVSVFSDSSNNDSNHGNTFKISDGLRPEKRGRDRAGARVVLACVVRQAGNGVAWIALELTSALRLQVRILAGEEAVRNSCKRLAV